MRYQIQKYNTSNYDERIVIDSDSFETEAEAQQWVASLGLQTEDGFGITLVNEQHQWFIVDQPLSEEPEPEIETTVSVDDSPVDFQTVAQWELAQNQKRRQEIHQAELEQS